MNRLPDISIEEALRLGYPLTRKSAYPRFGEKFFTRTATVLKGRFWEKKTLRQIAFEMGYLSFERIRQIEAIGCRLVRAYLKSLDCYDEKQDVEPFIMHTQAFKEDV